MKKCKGKFLSHLYRNSKIYKQLQNVLIDADKNETPEENQKRQILK